MADAIGKAAEAAAREFVEFIQTEEVKKIRTKEQGIANLADIIARHMREAVGWVSVDERLPEDEQRKGGA